MAEYICREAILDDLEKEIEAGNVALDEDVWINKGLRIAIRDIKDIKSAAVQPVKQCKMIPQKPDCRGYTDTFFCTNCQIHIHLGFIGQRYGGNYCIECGAEVEDGDAE